VKELDLFGNNLYTRQKRLFIHTEREPYQSVLLPHPYLCPPHSISEDCRPNHWKLSLASSRSPSWKRDMVLVTGNFECARGGRRLCDVEQNEWSLVLYACRTRLHGSRVLASSVSRIRRPGWEELTVLNLRQSESLEETKPANRARRMQSGEPDARGGWEILRSGLQHCKNLEY
jgi:hypothetical protein